MAKRSPSQPNNHEELTELAGQFVAIAIGLGLWGLIGLWMKYHS